MKSDSLTDIFKSSNNEYPMPSKCDLLSNKPLNALDFPRGQFKKINTTRNYSLNNYTLDIEGASPNCYGIHSSRSTKNINNNDDIEKSKPRVLYETVNKLDYIFSNIDIEGSQPKSNRDFITSRHTNPLSPDYLLPTAKKTTNPPNVSKFIRDSINVFDIEGSQSLRFHHKFIRDNLITISPEGTKKKAIYEYINYSDVSKKKELWKRCYNPLEPVYDVIYSENEKYRHGEIQGSKPNPFPKSSNGLNTNLNVIDIEGAKADTNNIESKWKRKHNRKLFTHLMPEIEGAKSGSLIKGIKTKRCINPLVPDYQFLDKNDDDNKQNNRFCKTNLLTPLITSSPNFKSNSKEKEIRSPLNTEIALKKQEATTNSNLVDSYAQTEINHNKNQSQNNKNENTVSIPFEKTQAK